MDPNRRKMTRTIITSANNSESNLPFLFLEMPFIFRRNNFYSMHSTSLSLLSDTEANTHESTSLQTDKHCDLLFNYNDLEHTAFSQEFRH